MASAGADWRVLYALHVHEGAIEVLRVRHRREATGVGGEALERD